MCADVKIKPVFGIAAHCIKGATYVCSLLIEIYLCVVLNTTIDTLMVHFMLNYVLSARNSSETESCCHGISICKQKK